MEANDLSSRELKLYSTKDALFLVRKGSVLKCCKITGKLGLTSDFKASKDAGDISEIGVVYGLVGALRSENVRYLLLIFQMTPVASFPYSEEKIFHVDKVCAIPVENNNMVDVVQLDGTSGTLSRIINQQKKLMKLMNDKIASTRIIDEILRLFNNDGDFYVSFGRNLTLNTQSYYGGKILVDKRFFWNRFLLNDFYDENGVLLSGSHAWISPICQGFVCESSLTIDNNRLTATLISRRSVERAGVRYLRRGVDAEGNVANFVETEVIVSVFGHHLSYVQVRGSVPIYWKQKGFRYRPPLIIDKPFTVSFLAFEKHMDRLLEIYGSPLTAVCLLDQTGRELALVLSYLHHVLHKDSANIGFFAFDFHFYCRALRFQKVDHLITALDERLKSMSFCWIDKTDQMVCEQSGVIRTNCVDCLDRTNVVQGAIAQAVCLLQLRKLGLVGPLCQLPDEFIRVLQNMWADNGDAVSRQYAGTNALKGDVTRSGQRGLVGIMRDGYNSASRYYFSHMKDGQRQLAIDTLLDSPVKTSTDELAASECSIFDDETKEEEESESIGRLVNETARFLLTENEMLIGGWALVDGSNSSDQVDTVLLLSRYRLMLASYDDDSENLLDLKSIDLVELKSIELGVFEGSLKLHMRISTLSCQQYTLRTAKTRLFNNVAIPIKSEDEANEYVQAIAEQIRTTASVAGRNVIVTNVSILSNLPAKRRPRIVNFITSVFRSPYRTASPNSLSSNQMQFALHDDKLKHNSLGGRKPHLSMKQVTRSFENPILYLDTNAEHNISPGKQAPSFNKMSRLKLSKSQTVIQSCEESKVTSGDSPFARYRQQILNSKSRIIFL